MHRKPDLRAALAAAEALSDLDVRGSPSESARPALAECPVATLLAAPHLAQRARLSAACRFALMPAMRFSHAILASCQPNNNQSVRVTEPPQGNKVTPRCLLLVSIGRSVTVPYTNIQYSAVAVTGQTTRFHIAVQSTSP